MIVFLIILGALVAVGLPLYLMDLRARRRGTDTSPTLEPMKDSPANDEGCCGMHITCQKDSLLATVSTEIEYFDDEELDAYRGREADSYTPQEEEAFREVLLTLRPDEIAPWARSIQLRGINLPVAVREELLLIVAEARKEAPLLS